MRSGTTSRSTFGTLCCSEVLSSAVAVALDWVRLRTRRSAANKYVYVASVFVRTGYCMYCEALNRGGGVLVCAASGVLAHPGRYVVCDNR